MMPIRSAQSRRSLQHAAWLATAVIGFSSNAFAVDRSWNGASSNLFTLYANWTANLAPGSGDAAMFRDQAGVARSLVVLDASSAVTDMKIDGTPAVGAYEFQQQSNSLLTAGNIQIGYGALGATPVTFNGFRSSSSNLAVSDGTLSLTGGAQATAVLLAATGNGVMNVGTAAINATSLAVTNGGKFNVNSGGSVSLTSALQLTSAGSALNVAGGTLNVGGNMTFSAGTTFNWSGGTWNNAAGTTLAFDGGAGSFTVGLLNRGMSNGSTLRITNGGKLVTNGFMDIGNPGTGGATATMLVDGAGSSINCTSTGDFDYTDWGLTTASAATVTFSNSGAGTYSGGLAIGATGGAATVNLQSSATLNPAFLRAGSVTATSNGVQINISSGTLAVDGDALLRTGAVVNYLAGKVNVGGTLTMSNNAQLLLTTGGNKVVRTGGLILSNTNTLDLADNALIVDYTGSSPASTIRGYLVSGRIGGAWTGKPLVSSSAAADPTHRALGYGEASAVLGASGGTFFGQTVDSTAVLVRFTYLGDSNLDGRVDVADLGALATHWQQAGDWSGGDFNYSGVVDVADLGMLATNWQAGVAPDARLGPSLAAALAALGLPNVSVPEPATLTIFGLSISGLLLRRRPKAA